VSEKEKKIKNPGWLQDPFQKEGGRGGKSVVGVQFVKMGGKREEMEWKMGSNPGRRKKRGKERNHERECFELLARMAIVKDKKKIRVTGIASIRGDKVS